MKFKGFNSCKNAAKYEKYLSDLRIPQETPNDIIDDNGNAVFGTFKTEFPNMNFLKVHNQSILPDFMNRFRLTLWQATEVNFDEVAILTAVCNMGLFGTSLTLVYDKKEEKVYQWQEILPPWNAQIAPTILNGDKSIAKAHSVKVNYENDFGNGKAHVFGSAKGKDGKVSYDVKLNRESLPSIVNIPFGKNKPLYSQKDLFSVEGYLEFNGKKYVADENTVAIIDDHRGYYPHFSHYDWVSTMGKKEIDGKEQYFGFNLTRNQSINQDDYNENLIWFEGKTTRLTPVKFKHLEYNKWVIRDEHDMVNITFDIGDRFLLKFNLLVASSDYSVVFGKLSGYIRDEDGNKFDLDGMLGMGEDKTVVA